jgi:Rrf2 family protein
MLSQKCQYAVRAMFELALRYGEGPVRISDIAAAQAIPARFLEVILSQLRRAGLVQSRRGVDGGYLLPRRPGEVTVGEIIQLVEGPLSPVSCMTGDASEECALHGKCVFIRLWKRAEKAVCDVYDLTSLQDLVDDDVKRQQAASLTYSI